MTDTAIRGFRKSGVGSRVTHRSGAVGFERIVWPEKLRYEMIENGEVIKGSIIIALNVTQYTKYK